MTRQCGFCDCGIDLVGLSIEKVAVAAVQSSLVKEVFDTVTPLSSSATATQHLVDFINIWSIDEMLITAKSALAEATPKRRRHSRCRDYNNNNNNHPAAAAGRPNWKFQNKQRRLGRRPPMYLSFLMTPRWIITQQLHGTLLLLLRRR